MTTHWQSISRSALLAVVALAGVAATTGCKEKINLDSKWAENTVTVDGHGNDWTDLSTSYFPDQEAVIGVANDSTRLYLMVRFRDAKWARAIKTSGLKLEFQTGSKDQKTFTLRYRGGPTPEQIQQVTGRPPSDARPDFPGEFRPPESDQRVFTCYIENRIDEKEIPVDGAEGPVAAFGMDQGLFTYEFSIPLARGEVRYYGLGVGAGKKVTLDATWGDMDEMRLGRLEPGGFDGGPPGGGMPGGGMPGGGPPGGMGRQRPDMPEKQVVRLEIDLSRGLE